MSTDILIAGVICIAAIGILAYAVASLKGEAKPAVAPRPNPRPATVVSRDSLQDKMARKAAIQEKEKEIALLQMRMKAQDRYQALSKWAKSHPTAVVNVLRKWMGEGKK